MRPYCHQFLREMSQYFELIIFTASRQDYADAVIKIIDPKNNIFSHRLYRQHCRRYKGKSGTKEENVFVKDIRVLKNRKKEDLILIDNYIYSFAVDIENGLLIKPYYSGKDDNELEPMGRILKNLKSFMDSPEFLTIHFKLDQFYDMLRKN